MLRFRDIPIKRKLMLVIMLTSTAALLVATAAVAAFSWKTVRRALANDLEAVADIVGANSTAAISFNDPKTAQETLSSVKTRPEIVSARIYDRKGKVLAKYDRDAAVNSGKGAAENTVGVAEPGRYLEITRPIWLDGEIIGRVQLQADLQQRRARLKSLAMIVGALILTSWLAALAFSTYLQRFISEPILALASLAREVQERKDYSLRAPRQGKDEIGALVDGFNQMLVKVQSRDEEVRASEERFRQLAENISEVFWMTDVGKQRADYLCQPGLYRRLGSRV
jgi:methyl-accepting chemotaxis protein